MCSPLSPPRSSLGDMPQPDGLRWRLADGSDETASTQPALFAEEEFTERHVGRGEFRGMEFLHVNARSIINEVPRASRLPFRYTINVYRGCSHACTYCFARPTHEYLGFNIGEDFERRIVVKVNAVERLRAELAARRWAGHHIAMGTNTDPYQRCEGKYHLTQGVVRRARRGPQPLLHSDQVNPYPAGSGPAGPGRGASRRHGESVHRDP